MNAATNIEAIFLEQLYGSLRENTLILPTLPEMALHIRDLAEDERTTISDISRAINKDPALAARVVQLANSPAFRTRTPFNSVDAAVLRLGTSMIKNIVTGMVMEQLFQSTSEVTDQMLRIYWGHAMEVAEKAMGLAVEHRHLHLDQAMLAGLVHDIGVLPILSLAEEYPILLENQAMLKRLIQKAHSQVGTAILAHWNFSDELITVAQEHENLAYTQDGACDYAELIIVADLISDHRHHDLLQIKDPTSIPAFRKFNLSDEHSPASKRP